LEVFWRFSSYWKFFRFSARPKKEENYPEYPEENYSEYPGKLFRISRQIIRNNAK